MYTKSKMKHSIKLLHVGYLMLKNSTLCQRFILQALLSCPRFNYCHAKDSFYKITVIPKIHCTGLLSCQRFIVQDYCNGKDSFYYGTQSMTVETGWSFVTSCDSGKHILYAENIFFIIFFYNNNSCIIIQRMTQ